MENKGRIPCLINVREFQVAIVIGILGLIINRLYPQISIWRLTPPSLPRQFFLTLEPANNLGVIGSCMAGPWAGLIIALLAPNPQFILEVGTIINVIQFMAIGYAYRKIQPPWNILSIPLGSILIFIIHPTIVGYILFRTVFVYLYFGTNLLFQTLVNVGIYLLSQLIVPQIFEWANPEYKYRLKLRMFPKKSKITH